MNNVPQHELLFQDLIHKIIADLTYKSHKIRSKKTTSIVKIRLRENKMSHLMIKDKGSEAKQVSK